MGARMRWHMMMTGTVVSALVITAVAPAAQAARSSTTPQISGLELTVRAEVGTRAEDDVTVTPADTVLEVQQNSGGTWVKLRQYRPDPSGGIAIRYPEAELGSQRYRIVASSLTAPDALAPQIVDVIGYQAEATLSDWPEAETMVKKGTPVRQKLTASPPGATVSIQQRAKVGAPWRDSGSTKVRNNGRVLVDLGRATEGTTLYRLVIPKQDLVGQRLAGPGHTVIGYGKVPPTDLLPQILNRLVVPLGIPQVRSSSVRNGDTARAACVATELSGFPAKRTQPGDKLRARWLRTDSFRSAPKSFTSGVNVSIRCQAAYFVEKGRVLRAVPVSTGKPGFPTNVGSYRIFRGVNGTETSRQFPDDHWNMYRSLYFNGGEALHGSYSDSYVYTYPASHGCVRMLHRDVDWLWRNGWTVGTPVRVYGSWR